MSWRLIALFVLAYTFIVKGYVQVSDTDLSLMTAESIVRSGRLEIPSTAAESQSFTTADGRTYSKYGIGTAIYFVPFVASAHALEHALHLPEPVIAQFLISFANIPFAILGLVVFARLLTHLGGRPSNARLLTLALGFGTLFAYYAAYDFTEEMQATLVLLAFYGVARGSSRPLAMGGVAFAFLVLVKLVHVVLFPCFLLYVASAPGATFRGRARPAVVFAAPTAVAGALLGFLNYFRFGNPLESGYGREARGFILGQVPHTLPALVVSAEKGILIFCPVLVLGIIGWPAFFRAHRREAALAASLVVVNLVLSSAWHSWIGGMAWGPRLLVPTLPLWLLPASSWLEEAKSSRRFTIAAIVTALSIALQIPGVFVSDMEIENLHQNVCDDVDRPYFPSPEHSAWILFAHKLRGLPEIYSKSDFGLPSPGEFDLSSHGTYMGFNVWTEHAARQLHRPVIRWIALAEALPFFLLLATAVRGSTSKRAGPPESL